MKSSLGERDRGFWGQSSRKAIPPYLKNDGVHINHPSRRDIVELPDVKIQHFSKASDVPWKRDEDCGSDDRGSYSIVFRALRGDEVFAVKDIRSPDLFVQRPDQPMIDSTMCELRLLKSCDHPNVLKYVAAYTNDKIPDHVFLVTQPWADMNLADFLGNSSSPGKSSECSWWNSRDPFNRCYHLFRGLLNGLAYLHSHSIFHKDIKPDNILLLGERPILADFGVSKLYRPLGKTRYTNSTYEYLAPEQINHESSTPQSDVFSMGSCFLRIMAVAVGGVQRLKEVDTIFYMNDTSCQYGNLTTIRRFMSMLQQQALASSSWPMSTLILLIRDMLVQDPSNRPTSSRLGILLTHVCNEEIKPYFLIRLPTRNLRLDTVMSVEEFKNPTICVLNASINLEERNKSGQSWVIQINICKPDSSEEQMPVTASFDTGSSANLISPLLIEQLTAQDYQLEYRPIDILISGLGGSIHIRRSLDLAVQFRGRLLSLTCLVLDTAEAYFDLLLGMDAVIALSQMTDFLTSCC